jgi:hypothetical protein
MLTTIAKRVQTRLSKQGVKVSLGDIRPVAEQSIKDIQNPTDQEVLSVVEYFLSSATKLAVISDDVTTEQTEIEETLTTEDVDIVNSVDNAINTASIQDIDSSDLYTNEAALNTDQPAPLATTTQSQLITTTADQMGIVLDASEISMIAENISISSDDFEQDIDAIKSAIMAFVQHKSLINQSKINQMIHEVREVVSEKNSENSQLLSDGLRSINQDIQEANKAFKSNVSKALAAFDIPALKAS